MKKLFVLLIVMAVFAACEKNDPVANLESEATLKSTADDGVKLVGEHFNLNLIGVKEKTMDDDIAAGNVIFVNLEGETQIGLVQGDDYAVLDKNGTDEDGALFQLPDPGVDAYITEADLESYGFYTETEYSVYARPLGKPFTGSEIVLEADTIVDLAIWFEGSKKELKLFEWILANFGAETGLTLTWGEYIPNPVTFERLKGKQEFQNVTAQLLTIVYELIVTYDNPEYIDEVETPGVKPVITEIFHLRIPIFSELLTDQYWKYDNNGLKLLQLRFYPFGTDVSLDDGFWVE